MKQFEGVLKAKGLRFALVAGRFNKMITEKLVDGAKDCLIRHGAVEDDIYLYMVPGSFEIPQVCAALSSRDDVDAIIAIGALIRGDTPHFELLASEVTRSLSEISMNSKIPLIFGMVTADSIDQAVERAGTKAGNKGWDAALAAIEMVNLHQNLRK
jgi:6,7-dimethyl-8-ribityllumazine synthase